MWHLCKVEAWFQAAVWAKYFPWSVAVLCTQSSNHIVCSKSKVLAVFTTFVFSSYIAQLPDNIGASSWHRGTMVARINMCWNHRGKFCLLGFSADWTRIGMGEACVDRRGRGRVVTKVSCSLFLWVENELGVMRDESIADPPQWVSTYARIKQYHSRRWWSWWWLPPCISSMSSAAMLALHLWSSRSCIIMVLHC